MKDFADWIQHHEIFYSTNWLDLFPNCFQMALSRPFSDHCSIVLELDLEDCGPPPFRMEMMWLKENSFVESVPEWWKEALTEGWMGF